jgi:dipicolinate synthase subunit A
MSIETFGTGGRLRVAASLSVPFGIERRIVLLPVPTTRDGKTVASTDIPISEPFIGADGNTYIFGYGIPKELTSAAVSMGAHVFDLSEDEEYLLENAELTAIGCIGYILTGVSRAPCEISVGIVGYGRIGKALARLLLFLGARVSVFSSREDVLRLLGEMGIGARSTAHPLDLSGIDILINTAPKDMSREFLHGVPLGMRIIELASGENFKGVSEVERLPGIPEKYYPESAGEVYYSAILKHVERSDIK